MNETLMIDFKTTKVRACTARRKDGSYVTIINARMAENVCREAFLHERVHVKSDDFDKDEVQSIETNAHNNDR